MKPKRDSIFWVEGKYEVKSKKRTYVGNNLNDRKGTRTKKVNANNATKGKYYLFSVGYITTPS